MTCRVFVTIDLDWASEHVIEETLQWFETANIPVTVFATHESNSVKRRFSDIEVGLHPYFHSDSSQGSTPEETLDTLEQISWNVPIYRSHRFLDSNLIREWMRGLGMMASSNVCTDLNPMMPFTHRSGMIEIPISFEDGGYMERGHDLSDNGKVLQLISESEIFVIVLHPMHFVLNTPNFQWMRKLKDRTSRQHWNSFDVQEIQKLKHEGVGISSFVQEILAEIQICGCSFEKLSALL